LIFDKTDRTAEIDRGLKKLAIRPTDFCSYYKKHPYTVLWKAECWTCKYGDFGIDTGNPTDSGLCRYEK
jgi:hypothetical protein